jgi:hypothetical protein
MDQPQYNPQPPAPRTSDPVEMATLTVQAVDQIGAAAASEIEKAANSFEKRASDIAEKMRKLAAGVREHSQLAGASVAEFCEKSTSVIETIRALQERLDRQPTIGQIGRRGEQ